jgi:hypothetical protein
MSRRGKRLRLAGLVVGIAGLIWILVLYLFFAEGGPGWWSIPALSIFGIPLILGLLLSYKQPVAGSISLIFIGVFWLLFFTIQAIVNRISQSISDVLLSISFVVVAISAPPGVAGILFWLSHKAEQTAQSEEI